MSLLPIREGSASTVQTGTKGEWEFTASFFKINWSKFISKFRVPVVILVGISSHQESGAYLHGVKEQSNAID